MIPPDEIYRRARMVLSDYGPEATDAAERFVKQMRDKAANPEEDLRWLSIQRAIADSRRSASANRRK